MHSDLLTFHGHGDGGSWAHRLDPRAKLATSLLLLVSGLLATGIGFHLVMSLVLVTAIVTAGVSGHTLWQTAKSIFVLVAITFLFHLLFTDASEPPLARPFGLAITQTALLKGAFFSLRLILLVSIVVFLTVTTPPTDLAEGVVKLARPLGKLRLPVDDIGLILSLALRFIPILRDEFVAIRRAQTLRGVNFTGSFFHRVRMTTSLLAPVFVGAVDRADTIALAIETRGYRHHAERTYFSRTRFGAREWAFVTSTAVIAIGLIVGTG